MCIRDRAAAAHVAAGGGVPGVGRVRADLRGGGTGVAGLGGGAGRGAAGDQAGGGGYNFDVFCGTVGAR